MSHLNKYSSIVPSEMSKGELSSMCTELTTAKNWGKKSIKVHLTSVNLDYQVDVADLPDYQEEFTPICGALTH